MNLRKYINSMGIRTPETGPYTSAIILAAGDSTRMKGINKQLIPLCDIPTIARTLSAFETSVHVREVVIVTKKINFFKIADIIKEFGFTKVTKMVAGGKSRQQSAELGLDAISDKTEFIAIHDGARPLVTTDSIDKVIEDAYEFKASCLACKVKDTLKIVNEKGIVVSTPDRNHLYAVQTPQVFEINLYKNALKLATDKEEDFTDDCQLIEALNIPVHIVEGDYTNIKITTKEDVFQAETYLRARGEGE